MNTETWLMIGLALIGTCLAIPWETLRRIFPRLPETAPAAVKNLTEVLHELQTNESSPQPPVDNPDQHVIALIAATKAKGDQGAMDLLIGFWAAFNKIDQAGP